MIKKSLSSGQSVYEKINRQIYIDRQMNRQIDRWIDRQKDGQTDRQMDRQIDRWIHRQIDGYTDRWIDFYINRQIVYFAISLRQGGTGIPRLIYLDG